MIDSKFLICKIMRHIPSNLGSHTRTYGNTQPKQLKTPKLKISEIIVITISTLFLLLALLVDLISGTCFGISLL
jgi:hypothetical protein